MAWIDRIDRTIGAISPRWQLRRLQSRMAVQMLRRHYEAASVGRRTSGWRRASGDANAVIGGASALIRDRARDLVRNNPYAESALSTIVDQAVGWGIVATPQPKHPEALAVWKRWAESTDCDADGRHDIYGLQKLVKRTVVESGEVLIRRRIRRADDGLALPVQLQVLDPDFLDTSKDTLSGLGRPSGTNPIIQGVEYDGIGRRVAYYLFPEHPGSVSSLRNASVRVPAESVLHVYRPVRPGQVRGMSWFAPVLLRFKDYDEFEDATLMKQKIAACLAVFVTDPNGSMNGIGTIDDTKSPGWDTLEPGAIVNTQPGHDIKVVDPPTASDYGEYSKNVLRAIATGLGVTYEDLTGDYGGMPFSAARMSRLRHWQRVEDWRWRILIPQFCDPVWRWAMEVAVITGAIGGDVPAVEWTAPPAPMIDPASEGLALTRLVRSGLQSLPDVLRERGYDPDMVFTEIRDSNDKLDELGLWLDSDPRKMTQAGQLQGSAAATARPETQAPEGSGADTAA